MKKLISTILALVLVLSCVQLPAQAAWQQQGGNWYYTDSNGAKVTGWLKVGNTWYYMNSQGVMQTGWVKVGSTWYYMNTSGAMQTGWVQLGSTWYYMNTSGAMVTGTVTIGGKQHQFNASGAWLGEVQQSGWVSEGGKWYYYRSGTKVTGWLKDGSTWYYMNSQGVMQTGWVQLGSTWYYMNTSGAMVTGTVTIGGKQHQFNDSGVWLGEVQQNGWVSAGGNWYYYRSGAKVTGWLKDGSTWYYMNSQGVMQTGWVQLGSTWYYMNTSGAMVTGTVTIDGKQHQFNDSGAWLGEVQDTQDPETPPTDATITIGLPINALILDYNDNALTQWLEEQTGYDIQFVLYAASSSDYKNQITTQIATGDALPDILLGCDLGATAEIYGIDGYLRDLTPYFLDTDGASKVFWDRLNASLTRDEMDQVMRTIYSREGDAIYSVPTITTDAFNTNCQAWINQEWLDALDLEMPTNMAELYNVLWAFKNCDPNGNGVADEIALFGAEKVSGGSVVEWLINMFLYYDSSARWQPDENGQLQPVFTQDAYREALRFVSKLRREGILPDFIWSASSNDVRQIAASVSGTPLVGVLVYNMGTLAQQGASQEILSQYAPMANWGNTVEKRISIKTDTYITEDCNDAAAAFKVLITLFSEEGTLRMRYGEKGVHWTDEDVWGDSYSGVRPNIRVLEDVNATQNTAYWRCQTCGLYDYDGSLATVAEDLDYQLAYNLEKAAKYVTWGVYSTTPYNTCPTFPSVPDDVEDENVNVKSYTARALTEFATGVLDPNNDADWNTYLLQLTDLGLADVTAAMQDLYDREAECIGKTHRYADATCTEARTCIYCGKVDGRPPKGHDFGEDSCSNCGIVIPELVDTRWNTYPYGNNQLSQPRLTFNADGTCIISIGYYDPITSITDGYATSLDWYWFDGMLYGQSPSGTWRDGTYTVSGNTVTMNFYGNTIEITKQSPITYVVTSSDNYVDVGVTFTAE